MEVLAQLATHLHDQLLDLSQVQARLRAEVDQPCGWLTTNIDNLFDLRREKMMRLTRFMNNEAVSTFINNLGIQDEDWHRTCVSTLDNARAACRALLDADRADAHDLSDRMDEAMGLAAWACMCQRVHTQSPSLL